MRDVPLVMEILGCILNRRSALHRESDVVAVAVLTLHLAFARWLFAATVIPPIRADAIDDVSLWQAFEAEGLAIVWVVWDGGEKIGHECIQ